MARRQGGRGKRWRRPAAYILCLVLQGILQLAVEVVGCIVRLLYWSVRVHGWTRVIGFALALYASCCLRARWGGLGFDSETTWSLILGTAFFYGVPAWVAPWVVREWCRRRQAALLRFPATPGSSPATIPPFPAPLAPAAASPLPLPTVAPAMDAVALPPSATPQNGSASWERMTAIETLSEAARRVAARGGGPGTDGQTVEAFCLGMDEQTRRLSEELRAGRYRPQAPRRVDVPKASGGTRQLAILGVRDRVAQQAACLTLSREWDRRFSPCSYAYRSGRSALQAVAAVEKALAEGRVWVVDADIQSFFDSVPHHQLFSLLAEWAPDPKVQWFLQVTLNATAALPGRGLPQGAPTSPLLANLYLNGVDTALQQMGHALVRYADDFVILCATRAQADAALRTTSRLLHDLELRLHPEKTRVVHRDEGFTFLGYFFNAAGKQPSVGSLESLEERLAGATDEDARQRILVGWQSYFRGEAPAGVAAATAHGEIASAMSMAPARSASPGGTPMASFPAPEAMGAGNQRGRMGAAPPLEEGSEAWEMSTESDAARDAGDLGLPASWEAYRARFLGRPDVFAHYWQRADGSKGYGPLRRPVTDSDLETHVRGEAILATYSMLPDSSTRALVLDVDGPEVSEEGRRRAFPVAQALYAGLRAAGSAPFWFESGGKGYHLWICFSTPIVAREARRWAQRLLDDRRPFPEGVLVEIFPKQDGLGPSALGSLIRLPLGLHPETRRRCALLDEAGKPVAHPWEVIGALPPAGPEHLRASGSVAPVAALPEPPEGLAAVVGGCTLIRALVERAAVTRQLRHGERLALLYTLGGCGEVGRNYLHQVLALCGNYDPGITGRWLARLEEGHRPVRCATLREWLRDHLPGVACACAIAERNGSPRHLIDGEKPRSGSRAAPPAKVPPALVPDENDWEKISADLFDAPVENVEWEKTAGETGDPQGELGSPGDPTPEW